MKSLFFFALLQTIYALNLVCTVTVGPTAITWDSTATDDPVVDQFNKNSINRFVALAANITDSKQVQVIITATVTSRSATYQVSVELTEGSNVASASVSDASLLNNIKHIHRVVASDFDGSRIELSPYRPPVSFADDQMTAQWLIDPPLSADLLQVDVDGINVTAHSPLRYIGNSFIAHVDIEVDPSISTLSGKCTMRKE